jgi:hypothetical protein
VPISKRLKARQQGNHNGARALFRPAAIRVWFRGIEIDTVTRVKEIVFRLIVYRQVAGQDVEELGTVVSVVARRPAIALREVG